MGQTPPVRIYLPLNPADENWSFLKDPTRRIEFWDHNKIHFPRWRTVSHTSGWRSRTREPAGDFRFTARGEDCLARGRLPPASYLLGANVHLSQRFRFYGELQSGLIYGKLNSPRPTDKNSFGLLHQGFFEWKEGLANDRSLSSRVGGRN